MRVIKEFFQALVCIILMISSLGVYTIAVVGFKILNQAELPILGLSILLMGPVASFACLINIKNIVLNLK